MITNSFNPLSDIVLYHGDAGDLADTIPDNYVKLIITSPPYNLNKSYETKISLEQYLKEQGYIIKKLYRLLKSDGSICWQVGNFVDKGEVYPSDIFYYRMFKNLGMGLRNRIVWHYGHGLHARKRLSGRYETILWFTKSKDYTFNLDVVRVPSKYPGKKHYKGPNKGKLSGNPLGKNPSDVWDISNVKHNHPEKTIHPCQFPVEVAERCILALTNKEGVIYDPYAGVGSSIIAAIKNNRWTIASEKELEYVDIAHDRIRLFYGDGDLSNVQ